LIVISVAALAAAGGGTRTVWAGTIELGQACLQCHQKLSPSLVTDWKASKHAEKGVGCDTCHGTAHTSAADVAKAGIVGPETCAKCHEGRVKEFMAGKHALAWKCATNMPNFPHVSRVPIEGGKGAGVATNSGPRMKRNWPPLRRPGRVPRLVPATLVTRATLFRRLKPSNRRRAAPATRATIIRSGSSPSDRRQEADVGLAFQGRNGRRCSPDFQFRYARNLS